MNSDFRFKIERSTISELAMFPKRFINIFLPLIIVPPFETTRPNGDEMPRQYRTPWGLIFLTVCILLWYFAPGFKPFQFAVADPSNTGWKWFLSLMYLAVMLLIGIAVARPTDEYHVMYLQRDIIENDPARGNHSWTMIAFTVFLMFVGWLVGVYMVMVILATLPVWFAFFTKRVLVEQSQHEGILIVNLVFCWAAAVFLAFVG